MSERVAQVKLTLDNGQFLVTIKQTGDEVDKQSKRGKKSMDLFGGGIDRAKKSMGELGGTVKQVAGMAAGLLGGFTLGTAVSGAVKLRSSYQSLAFSIQQAGGAMMNAAQVQQLVERTAADTGRTNEEMAKSFDELRQATGDLDFSRKALTAVGNTATATGEDLDTIVSISDQLHTKFGIAAENMQDTLAQVFQMAQRGGPSFKEFSDVIGSVGAELLAAGLDGQKGLDFMLGALVQTDDRLKSLPAQVKGLKGLLRGLGEKSELDKLAAKLALDPKKLFNEKDAIARLRMILGTGQKGVEALMGSMKEGEEKETMKILFTDPFEKALADANASGMKGKAAIDSALGVFDKGMEEFGKATLDGAALQREAQKKREEPEARLREALNRLNTAMGQPQIIQAIDDLSKHLPKLAEIFGDLVTFAAQNPILAATLGIGGKAAASFVAGMTAEIIKAHVQGGRAAAAQMGAGAGAGGAPAGSKAIGALGAAGVIAGTAVTAFAVGKEGIDNAFAEDKGRMDELSSATMAGFSGGGSIDELKARLARLKKAAKGAETAGSGGLFDMVGQLFHDGPSSADQMVKQQELAGQAIARLESKIRIAERNAEVAAAVAAVPVPAGEVKKQTATVDAAGGQMIAAAMKTALGGQVLTVRLANAGEVGLGRASPGPGGSRGPMAAPVTRQGGGV
jgi:hypothetical protein